MDRIDRFLDALQYAFAAAGENAVPWPMHVSAVHPYFAKPEAMDLYTKLKALVTRNEPSKTLGELFVCASAAKAALLDLVIGMKILKPPISSEERVWFVETIFDAIEEIQPGDIFCQNGRNLRLFPYELTDLCHRTPWLWVGSEPGLINSVQKTSATIHGLNWSLYFYAWPDTGFEIHGPYDINLNGKKFRLLVRDFFDARPVPLWDSMKTFQHESIRIMILYDKDSDLQLDIFNHLFSADKLSDITVGVYVEADGTGLQTQNEIEALQGRIAEKLVEQSSLIQSMRREELARKFVEIRYYSLRKWRMYFNEDWHPPESVLQRIRELGMIDVPSVGSPSWELLGRAFDPRDDFAFH